MTPMNQLHKLSQEVTTIRQPKLAATYVAELLGITLQGLHKQLKSLGVQCPKLANKSYITHAIAQKLFNIDFKQQKIAFQIVKGGTGKTTSLHNISCAASLYGAKILAIDLDPQGNLTDAFAYDPYESPVLIDIINKEATLKEAIINVEEGIDLLPSRIENVILDSKLAMSKAPLDKILRHILAPIENDYDFIFIDCPPMMGHSVTAATLYSDSLVVPLNPDKFSAKGLKILKTELYNINNQYEQNIEYKVFLNKYNGNTILSDKAIQTTIAAEINSGNALTTAIRHTQEIPNITDMECNMFSALKNSLVRDDFDALTRELLNINIDSKKKNRM
ncbi:Plasmid partitioning protein ParA (plasmid) [Rickettsiales bacterium Ac37b]|nr:Plasmid partitioning protein ParA [Rickettsiales bacterium Ac37b]